MHNRTKILFVLGFHYYITAIHTISPKPHAALPKALTYFCQISTKSLRSFAFWNSISSFEYPKEFRFPIRVDALLRAKNVRVDLKDAADDAPVPERVMPGISIESFRFVLIGLVGAMLLVDDLRRWNNLSVVHFSGSFESTNERLSDFFLHVDSVSHSKA
jgi:hypothetical protein